MDLNSPARTKPFIDTAGIDERVALMQTRSLKGESKYQALILALSVIDLTTLEGKDTAGKVEQLCQKALHPDIREFGHVAAVCVYPTHVATARRCLNGSPVKIASVATAFPSGNSYLDIRLEEVKRAVGDGADEVDMVINRGAFLCGQHSKVHDEIAEVKGACGKSRLKVILETGELSTLENVRVASDIAMSAGADFIKTSTGKISVAATMPVTLVMMDAISDHFRRTGTKVGLKPAGGISTAKQALQYLVMLNETLGDQWMTPEWFRFGASSLANDVIMQLQRGRSGVYFGRNYISGD